MAAVPLTAPIQVKSRPGTTKIQRYLMKASTTIYKGGIVMLDSDGLALQAIAEASNQGCPGLARETVTSGASVEAFVHVEEGEFLLKAVSVADTSVGLPAYALDDQTVDETQLSNQARAGIISEVVSSTKCWVRMGLGFAS